MKYLTADFGSTYTKLTAIDSDTATVLGTSLAFTTIETDVIEGFRLAMSRLEAKIGPFRYDKLLCCSSAAGGLKMVALGLVPELTAKAARMAASSAGAKVIKTYSFEISKSEEEEIYQINPDLVLLCGGTDGGNKEVIISNAKRLCGINRDFSIIAAGNKSATDELEAIFSKSNKNWVITKNVMPEFNKINIEPAKESIKDLFISRIIEAKGLSAIQQMSGYQIIPTPLAVFNGCELLSKGTKNEVGIGDLMAVDLGGATTDVYSMASGAPNVDNVMVKGLPEPYSKRTVEGDLGMRYSLPSLFDEVGIDALAQESGLAEDDIKAWVEACIANPDIIAEDGSTQQRIEELFARNAVRIAVERHCGEYQSVFTTNGQLFTLVGKDLSTVPYVVGIGGAIINNAHPLAILEGAKNRGVSVILPTKPNSPKYLLDKKYIFASMGLLSAIDPDMALKIMKKEITQI